MFNDIANEGKGVVVAYSPLVQGSIIHDGMKLSALLLPVEESGGVW